MATPIKMPSSSKATSKVTSCYKLTTKNPESYELAFWGGPKPVVRTLQALSVPRRLALQTDRVSPLFAPSSIQRQSRYFGSGSLYECLCSQDLAPTLVVLVDNGSPGPDDSRETKEPGFIAENLGEDSSQRLPTTFPTIFTDRPLRLPGHTNVSIPTLVFRLPSNKGPAAARNAEMDRASDERGQEPGNTILFMADFDCLPPCNWISNGCRAERYLTAAQY